MEVDEKGLYSFGPEGGNRRSESIENKNKKDVLQTQKQFSTNSKKDSKGNSLKKEKPTSGKKFQLGESLNSPELNPYESN